MYSLHKSEAKALDLPGRTVHVLVGSEKLSSDRMTFGVTEVPPNTSMSPHSHEVEEEIVYVMEGFGEAQVGDSVEKLEPGTAVVFPVGVRHTIANQSKNVMKFTFCFSPCRDFNGR